MKIEASGFVTFGETLRNATRQLYIYFLYKKKMKLLDTNISALLVVYERLINM